MWGVTPISRASPKGGTTPMFLVDTNVISEARKGSRANPGVRAFFAAASEQEQPLYLASITIGELRRSVDLIRRRGDGTQADALEHWLAVLLEAYGDRVLVLDAEAALLHGLTVVTRNTADFLPTGVALLNPFHSPTDLAP
jgi:predicted nucleic acid-binding protein